MYLPLTPRRLAMVLLSLTLAIFLVAPQVYAQGGTTGGPGAQATTSAPTPPVSPTTTVSPPVFGPADITYWDWGLRFFSAVALSLIAAWAISRVFLYTTHIQERYFDTTETLARQGQTSRPVVIDTRTAEPRGAIGGEDGARELEELEAMQVKGPGTLIVGIESDEYTATFNDQPRDATWVVIPEGAASARPSQGPTSTVRVTPKQLGAFNLKVNAEGATEVYFPVAVVAPATATVDLPFIGEGWGTVILAIIFGTAVALLGLSRVIDTAMVGTLLGALLGYIFGVVRSGDTASRGADRNAPRRNE